MLIDFVNEVTRGVSLVPETLSGDVDGSAVDMHEGTVSTAAELTSGAETGTGQVAVKIQESDDAVTWTDIVGAVFPTLDDPNELAVIRFLRTKRYVRAAADHGGTAGTFIMGVSFYAQRKYVAVQPDKGGYDRSPST